MSLKAEFDLEKAGDERRNSPEKNRVTVEVTSRTRKELRDGPTRVPGGEELERGLMEGVAGHRWKGYELEIKEFLGALKKATQVF